MKAGKNHEGYSDPTASYAVGHLTHEEKKKEKKRKEEKKRDNKSNVLGSTRSGCPVSDSTGSVYIRDGSTLPLSTKGRKGEKGIHGRTEKKRRKADSGNQGNAGEERRNASEKEIKKERSKQEGKEEGCSKQ